MSKIKPRVLFVSHSASMQGGAERCMFRLVEQLQKRGYPLSVALPSSNDLARKYQELGIKPFIVPIPRARRSLNPIFWLGYLWVLIRSIRALKKIIKQNYIDIVHLNELVEISGLFGAVLAGVSVVMHVRVILQRPRALVFLLAKLSTMLVARIVCVSQAVKKEMFDELGVSSENIFVIYDAGPGQEFFISDGEIENYSRQIKEYLGVGPDVKIIGLVAKFVEVKGHLLLIDIIKRLANYKSLPDFRVVVVGGQVKGHERYYRQFIGALAQSKLQESFIVTGFRPDILPVMCAFDINLHLATYQEPFPGTVLEAMALKKPVVAFNSGGIPEQLDHGRAGLLIRLADVDRFSAALAGLLQNREARKETGLKGYNYLRGNFNWDRHLKEIEELYAGIPSHQPSEI